MKHITRPPNTTLSLTATIASQPLRKTVRILIQTTRCLISFVPLMMTKTMMILIPTIRCLVSLVPVIITKTIRILIQTIRHLVSSAPLMTAPMIRTLRLTTSLILGFRLKVPPTSTTLAMITSIFSHALFATDFIQSLYNAGLASASTKRLLLSNAMTSHLTSMRISKIRPSRRTLL